MNYTQMAEGFIQMPKEKWDSVQAELTRLREAIGLATTIKDDMEMDSEHPIEMMQEVATYVATIRASIISERKTIAVALRKHVGMCSVIADYVERGEFAKGGKLWNTKP